MKIISKMLKNKPVINHFKIQFPIPETRVQSCIKKLQEIDSQNTEAIFVSFNGYCDSPNIIQTLQNGFYLTNTKHEVPVFTFLEENATSMTYMASTCGVISINPYCLIGDIGRTHKGYNNIQKLLKFFGIKIDHFSTYKKNNFVWNSYVGPNENEKQIAGKWLNAIQTNMINTVSERRRIPLQTVQQLKNKIFSPEQALELKLVDHIQTMQAFKSENFSQVPVKDIIFSATSKTPNFASAEITVLMKLNEALSMPQVALLSLEDPLKQCVQDVIGVIQARMEDPEKLEELDQMLGNIVQKIELKLENSQYGDLIM